MERDEWCKAILDGCRTRRKSDARLRRGTVTAKQYMEEVKIEKKQRELKKQSDMSEEQDDPFSGLDCSLNLNLPSSIIKQAPHKKEVVRRRSQTVTSSIESPGSTKSLKRGKCVTDTSKKRSSIFYVHPATTDVTTPFVLPVMEMDSLVVANRSPSELLDLMTTELESLAEYVLPTTTGKSRVDMIVTRMGNIISALRQRTIEQEDGENHQDCLSPSSIGSSHSLPSERVADESSDSCSIVSSDELCTRESPSETLATSAHSDTQSVPHHNNFSEVDATTTCRTEETSGQTSYITEVTQSDIDNSSTFQITLSSSILEATPTIALPPPCPQSVPFPEASPSVLSQRVPIPPLPPAAPPPPLPPGAPPPPPPPGITGFGATQLALPALPVRRPTRKMKRFHWNLIAPAAVQSSVWLDVAKKEITDDIDFAQLEKLFSAETQDMKKTNIVKKEALKSLLDNTRSRNIEIFLPRFPLKVELLELELDQQLNVIDGSTKLNVEHIVALKRFQPTQEEKEMYKKYAGDKTQLTLADTFLLKLIEVPMLSMRLDLVFTIREFPVNMDEFQPTLELAWTACHELDKSEEFLEVLRYVLAIGNYLNAGTPKGNAYGFQLKYLPKLMEFRGQERTSLLDFLVQQLHAKKTELLAMPSGLQAVAKASEISIVSILAEIEVMGNELDKIEQNGSQVAQHPQVYQKAGQHLQKEVKQFVSSYRVRLEELDRKAQEMNATYHKLLTKFGEQSIDSEDFFSTISQFLLQFKKVVQERLPCTTGPRLAGLAIS
jgi:hypothetical protein